ncbi:MAG: hypothetical protein HPKKFMNG_02396 [Planctomycetes bacterium]|nr:hypothetical protein [Planctomycetota bacterium]
MLLVLHRAQRHGVFQVNQARHATARGAEELALGLGGAGDDVVGSTQELAQEFGFGRVEGSLEVRGEESVLDVDSRRQGEFGDAPQDYGLVGRLLGVLGKEHDPAGIQGGIDVVVAAVNVEGVAGKRAGSDLDDHGRELARRVIVLLQAVNQALTRGEVDHAPSGHGGGDGSALGGVLALGLDGDLLAAKHVQLSFGPGKLVILAHLGAGRDGVEHAGIGDARLGVVGNQLVAVGGEANAGEARFGFHGLTPYACPAPGLRRGELCARRAALAPV